jgi:hypothetical protein
MIISFLVEGSDNITPARLDAETLTADDVMLIAELFNEISAHVSWEWWA